MSMPREDFEKTVRDREDANDTRASRRHYGDDADSREAHIRSLPPEVQADIRRQDALSKS